MNAVLCSGVRVHGICQYPEASNSQILAFTSVQPDMLDMTNCARPVPVVLSRPLILYLARFEAAKQLLAPGCKRNATISVLNTLLDRVLTQPENVQASSSRTFFSRNEMMLDSADEDASDQDLFVVERKTFKSLCSGLVQQCGCLSNPSWTIASFIKKGHVARVQFVCPHCKQSRVWASSRVLSRHYLANQKLVHAFTCAGMLPRQYMNFYLFAGMGVVKQKNISSVYQNKLYQQVVADVAEESMKAAVERVKESPHRATSGENFMDAQSCFREMVADLQSQLNPDDISVHLYSAALLTTSELDEVNNHMLSNHARITKLLSAVGKAILIDANYFSAFLNVLDKTPRYRPIARRARE
ncbi:hypothetical protein EMCRGX_G022345 [Ephydatia muelleri]